MQYIQLQGQVAADLDLPLEGSYNLFIDTSDNSIKAKDSDGHMHGGGGLSLTELTRDEIGQLVVSASLTPGAFYKITNAVSRSFYETNEIGYSGMGNEIQDGGTTIILQAATDKTLSKKGIGLFYVPNYENPQVPTAPPDTNYLVWDNTHRLDFTNLSGRFDHNEYVYLNSSNEGSGSEGNLVANIGGNSLTFVYDSYNDKFFSNPANFTGLSITGSSTNTSASIVDYEYTSSYNAGDCVIWGGRVWANRSGSIGYKTGSWPLAQLQLNEQDWTKVPFNETQYTIVADLIEYEFEWDNISYRKGANNVEVRCDARLMLNNWGYNTMKYFPWGHTNIQNINISNSYLDAFVNYPHDGYAAQITFKDYGGFNSHYWGRETGIYNISSDFGGHMVSLNLGWNTQINNITLGIDARLSDIYTYDNDNYYEVLNNIVIGDNAEISSNSVDIIYMYHNSYMENLILENNSYISDINLYNGSSIRDTKLGIRSHIAGIGLNDYADFRQVELGISSYIEYINADVSACFKRTKLGIDSNISYFGIGVNGYFKHVEMGDQSSMYCNGIGDYSYFQYVNLGINSQIYLINQTAGNSRFEYINVGIDSTINHIQLGTNSSFNHITLGSNSSINNIDASGGEYVYFENIDIKNTSLFGSIDMESGSYVRRMDIGTNCEVTAINLTANTSISDFSILNDAGFGGLNIYSGSDITNFEIGQNSGFGGMDITSSMDYVTISRGFNNFRNNQTFTGISGNAHTQQNDLPYINFGNNGIAVLDITGFPADTVNYRLYDGDYEGQEIKFVVRVNSGTVYPAPTDVRVWADHLQYPIQYNATGYVTYCSFAPFAHYDPIYNSGEWVWRTMGRAIWTNGAWVTDAEFYYD
jgi:hypothetical protein